MVYEHTVQFEIQSYNWHLHVLLLQVEEALMSENSQDERTAWGRWLASTAQSIPTEKWRQFQCETFKVAMHFLPVEPIGDHPPVLAQTPPHRPILRRQQTMDINVPQQRVAIQPPQTTTPMSLEQCRTTDPSRASVWYIICQLFLAFTKVNFLAVCKDHLTLSYVLLHLAYMHPIEGYIYFIL